jgi:hypothetical protein
MHLIINPYVAPVRPRAELVLELHHQSALLNTVDGFVESEVLALADMWLMKGQCVDYQENTKEQLEFEESLENVSLYDLDRSESISNRIAQPLSEFYHEEDELELC